MARSRKYSRKSQKRRQRRSSKRRGQTGGSLAFSEINTADTAGGGAHMLKVAGGPGQQMVGANGAIQVNQSGGARKSRASRKNRKLRGGSLMDALSSAVVPLALFGMNHKIGRRLRKK